MMERLIIALKLMLTALLADRKKCSMLRMGVWKHGQTLGTITNRVLPGSRILLYLV